MTDRRPSLPQSQRIMEAVSARAPRLLTSYLAGPVKTGQTPIGLQLAAALPETRVVFWCFDLFEAQRLRVVAESLSNVEVCCQPFWPPVSAEVTLLQLSRDAAAELACELIQTAWQNLAERGELWVRLDNPRDAWTHRQLKNYAAKVRVERDRHGVSYGVDKRTAATRQRGFSSEFAFRDQGALLYLTTLPGVFSHRRLDNGARQLMQALPVGCEGRLMDLGCGSGAVALAAAQRNPAAHIVAVDSNCRALEVLSQAKQRNGLSSIQLELNWDGAFACGGNFDWVFTNPPYFANHRIAMQFIDSARRVLKDSGQLVVVTKSPREIAERVGALFAEVEIRPGPNYTLVLGRGRP